MRIELEGGRVDVSRVDAPPRSTLGRVVRGVVQTARPRQWVKNVLVVAAPLGAGKLLEPKVALPTVVAFVAFCLAASAVYLINDVIDVEADRAHPTKRDRPIAAGIVAPRIAIWTAVLAAGTSIGGVLALRQGHLALVIVVYLVLQVAYCMRLKHEPVVDLALVSSGFLLRAIAGGVAAGVTLSAWFLLVAAFGSLFMVAGKRYSEIHVVGPDNYASRAALEEYSQSYLRFVWSISAACTITFYCLWAFDANAHPNAWSQMSIGPFALAMLRYAVDIDRGSAGEPEAIVLGDRVIQALGLGWLVLFVVGVLNR